MCVPTRERGNEKDYNRQALLQLINGIGKRAGVPDAHPHRYRHTFVINCLRSGGDPYTLQALLGHETMETVQIYLQIAQADLYSTHDRASPVENWRFHASSDTGSNRGLSSGSKRIG